MSIISRSSTSGRGRPALDRLGSRSSSPSQVISQTAQRVSRFKAGQNHNLTESCAATELTGLVSSVNSRAAPSVSSRKLLPLCEIIVTVSDMKKRVLRQNHVSKTPRTCSLSHVFVRTRFCQNIHGASRQCLRCRETNFGELSCGYDELRYLV